MGRVAVALTVNLLAVLSTDSWSFNLIIRLSENQRFKSVTCLCGVDSWHSMLHSQEGIELIYASKNSTGFMV